MQHGFAIGLKKLLGEFDAFRATIAFDLAFVSVELDSPESSIVQQRRDRGLKRGQNFCVKILWRAVKANS